jgi:hypothetical protein
VLHPSQFHVSEAWIVFKLNDAPIRAGRDGNFDFVALMDAASCFILGSTPVSAQVAELSRMESRRLLEEGHAHKEQWPQTLFVPDNLLAQRLSAEAERHGIAVVQISEDQLLPIIGEAREGFREHFSHGRA